jgi:hypothetical protein
MKNLVIPILLAAAVIFGAISFLQTRKAAQAQARADALLRQVINMQSALDQQKSQTARLSDQLEEMRAASEATIREAVKVRQSLQETLTNQAHNATARASGRTNSNPFAEMFKNPAMKEMIKNQQKTAMGAMIDKNYARLFSDLHLTPDQSAALKDLILNKQLGAADLGMSMFTDDQDPTNRAALGQQIKAANDAADAQIKDFLGDDNFTQYQSYEKSLGERMAVSGLQDQLAGGSTALTDDQQQQLIQAMTQERQNFKFTTDLSDKSKFTGDFSSMFTDDKIDTYFQESSQLNQQYLTAAQQILSPDQLAAFDKYLQNQQTMQKAGMQMAAKMFAPAKPAGE